MGAWFEIKDHFQENRLFQERIIVALVLSAFLVLGVLARLIYLQVYAHEHFTMLSHGNRVDIRPLLPRRGLIYDRNGVLLAENIPSFSLEVVPERVGNLDSTLAALQELIPLRDEAMADFRRRLKKKGTFEKVPLALHLSEEAVARFAVNRHRFPGVSVEARLIRYYPQKELFAHVVGYVGRINEAELQRLDPVNYRGSRYLGKTGVEKAYEAILHGSVGFEQVEVNAQGRVIQILRRMPPVPGHDLYLSLDSRLQAVAIDALGEYNGAVVALDPKTGDVLAMVSRPGFDPNVFVTGLSDKSFAALRDSPDRPLYDRALRGLYPPGSTLKPFMALAGLEWGLARTDKVTYCPGWYKLPGHSRRYRCWRRRGHGSVDLAKAVAESCDVYFYDLAVALGIDRIYAYLGRFGFGRKVQIDIPGERAGLLPSRDWKRQVHQLPWFPGETVITGIGQGFIQATPLQLATIVAVLAEQGVKRAPGVVYASRAPGAEKITLRPTRAAELVSINKAKYWEQVEAAMVEAVHGERGTARRISKDLSFQIAGKTGTAQVFSVKENERYTEAEVPMKLRDHALFIAYAPVADPVIAVAVVVENGGHGGSVAAPIGRRLIDVYLDS
ncbi:penicillin-binding protein 2 [Nitrosococcus wardiae]|uniref:Peptidoglycan D,D-transpeptidase MrdA n=1 Tax=Nitrosococcus wardiae TaxID=1814290 RepID=A0A4P7BW42_9GAMM|nr:penicillin-binding protein 2 [Nitrosococcus wardiae]QBQ53300.1 penicillin-binding protein 2 [Nitrosococcus wardiae]